MTRLRTFAAVAITALLAALLSNPARVWAVFAQHHLDLSALSGTVGVNHGGTGATTLTAHGVVLGEGTSPVAITSAGSSGQPLLSGGAAADPNWGTLGLSFGGTGQVTAAASFDALAPTTTRGDIIIRGASSNTRLGLGATGIYPRSNGTDLVDSTVAAGGAGSCTNQFVRATVDNTTPTCASVAGTDFANQSANQIFGGPASGASAAPTFRTLTTADVPHSSAGMWTYDPGSDTLSATMTANTNFCGVFTATGVTGATKMYWGVTTAGSTACSVGIYDLSGTKIADSGTKDCSTSAPLVVTATGITAFTLATGTQYYACICNNGANGVYVGAAVSTTATHAQAIANIGTTKHFGTGNGCTTGAQPGSLTLPLTSTAVTPALVYVTSES